MTSIGNKLPAVVALHQQPQVTAMDQTTRKSAVPNAWARGSTNPITQRPAGASTNGVASSQARANAGPKSSSDATKESNTPDRHANDRMMFLFANLIGLQSTITLQNGEKYSGIFSAYASESADAKYILKMVTKVSLGEKNSNGVVEHADTYCGVGNEHTMAFPVRDVVDLYTPNVRLDKQRNGASQNGTSSFKTDTDISSGFAARERDLQRWDGGLESDASMSLDAPSNGQQWDQFEANERLYGLKTNYDESFYTTTIDRSHPEFRQREARAAQLAKEIERSATLNAHVAEERGHKLADDKGEDEEDKYSGVRRESQPTSGNTSNKYTPPARRAPSSQTTVAGAPVDPAIITSTLAKPSGTDALATKGDEKAQPQPSSAGDTAGVPEQTIADAVRAGPVKSPVPATVPPSRPEESATETVPQAVFHAFKQFKATEKLKYQEQQRTQAKRDKAVKLNDLKKFAQNFKLNTEVPRDLIPILAKDKGKQEQIVQKALQNIHEHKSSPSKAPHPASAASSGSAAQGASTPAKQNVARANEGAASTTGPPLNDRQTPRNRQNANNVLPGTRVSNANQQSMPRQHQGIGQRLAQQYSRTPMAPMPHQLHDPRLPPSGPAVHTGLQSPPGRQQYNLRAPEFRPNPSAHTFLPGPSSSSGASPTRSVTAKPVAPRPGNFFAGRRSPIPDAERKTVQKYYNSPARMLRETNEAGKAKDYAQNGGIPQAYRTPPTWDVPDSCKDIKYTQLFEKERMPPISPSHSMVSQQHSIAHQHQLPMHLQSGPNIPVGHTPQHTPRHNSVQPHMTPNGHSHFDDHQRMQYSASTSSMQPSPRANMPQYTYNGQVGHPTHGQVMPGYGMGPGGYPMTMRQVSGGPQYMSQGMPQMGGHMMANQASSGPYMQMNSQVPMYAAMPSNGYAHHSGPMTPQSSAAGFPSPRQPAPMKMHQGSQQGHPQMMYMSPGQHSQNAYGQSPATSMRGPYSQPSHYSSSPHQSHHFPQQHRVTPSASYAQPMGSQHTIQTAAVNGGHATNEAAEDVR